MATLCKNCSHALVFNPASQLLECSACGSMFRPEEVEAESKEYREDLKAEAAGEVYGDKEDKSLMDCYVYTCSECGGEIIVNGTEASTTCVYCGNPNVKERAIELARNAVKKGVFVPREIKNFSVDCCRGIYLPYWIVKAKYADSVVIKGQVKSGKNSVTKYFGRSGTLDFDNLPIDASKALSDESSAKLEPYNLFNMKPFDEDYLAGFYSNVSDVTYSDVRSAALLRAQEFFNEEAINDVKNASAKEVISSCPSIKVDPDMVYAMLPAWFITFNYKGKHNTILVNGDSGKVVCGLPWKKVLFYCLLIGVGIAISVAAYFVFRATLPIFFSGHRSSSSSRSEGRIIAFLIAGIVALFSTGIRKVIKVIKSINLTQDKEMFNFMKKRQG